MFKDIFVRFFGHKYIIAQKTRLLYKIVLYYFLCSTDLEGVPAAGSPTEPKSWPSDSAYLHFFNIY